MTVKRPSLTDDPKYWLQQAEDVMNFIRHAECITAPDRFVWLFKANALDQLAAFLQESSGQRKDYSELQGDIDPDEEDTI